MIHVSYSLAGIALLGLLAAGCGVESGTSPTPEVPVGLTVSVDMTPPTITLPGGDADKTSRPDLGSAPDSVTITSGLLLVRSVRLNTDAVSAVDTVITAADESRDVSDASVRFHGPYVIDVEGRSTNLGETSVPAGNYEQVTFVLQKARSTDNLSGYEELMGSSILVTGKVWRGGISNTFEFETDYTSEIAVNGSFSVDASTEVSLNLQFQAGQWFHNGNQWLDPEVPSNNLRILSNVRRNISGTIEVLN